MDHCHRKEGGCSMMHESSGVKAVDVSIWPDTPCLFVAPYEGDDDDVFVISGS